MANDVKWSDWRSSERNEQPAEGLGANPRAALLQLLGCVVGLGLLAVVLPGPANWVGMLNGNAPGTQGLVSIGATAETAILVTASVVVWFLLAWVLAVSITAVASRLPGTTGRCGRALLRRIAPAAAGRVIAAAVGVSLLAGTSACAVPAIGDLKSDSSTQIDAGSSATSAPAPLGGGAGAVESATSAAVATPTATEPASLAEVLSSISIDWPAVVSPTITLDTAAQPSSDAVVDTAGPADTTSPSTTSPSTASPNRTSPTTTSPSITAPAAPSASPLPGTADSSTSTTAAPGAPEQLPAPDESATGTTDVAQAPPTPGAPTGSDAGLTNTSTPPPGPAPSIAGAASPGGVAVLAGDTLWSIAHHHLKPDATDHEIDTAWRAWYAANPQVIGDNPDLIQPGQLLLPPDPEMGR